MAAYSIGSAILRIENREERRATVMEATETADGTIYRLAYAEGGDGWWPEAAIEADTTAASST